MNICLKCGEVKEVSLFYKRNSKPHSYCKQCCDKKSIEWRSKNREKERTRSSNNRFKNPDIACSYVAKRRSLKLQATPKWLTEDDFKQIRSIYKQAHTLTKQTGVKHHVDHIIPLRGKNVSGLHIPSNLQILTAEENLKKGNVF